MQDKLNQAKTSVFSIAKTLLKHSKEASKAVERSGCLDKLKGLARSTCDTAAKKIAEKTAKKPDDVAPVQNTADKIEE